MPFWRKRNFWRAIVICMVLGGLYLVKRYVPIVDWMKLFIDWVKTHGTLGMTLYVVSFALGSVFFFPASLFTLGAGMAFGFVHGAILANVGAAFGAALSFLISRHLARGFVEKRLAKNERLKAFDAAIAQEGWRVVLLLRLVPIFPFPVGNYFFGLTRVRFWPFFFATMAGVLPGCTLYVYLGYSLKELALERHHTRTMQENIFLGLGLVATIVVFAYLTRVAKRALRQIEEKSRTP